MRLRAKLALALAPVLLAPLLALGWLAFDARREALEREPEREMRRAVAVAHQALDERIGRMELAAALLAAVPEVRRAVIAEPAPDTDDAETLRRLLDDWRAAYPELLEARLIAADGSELARAAAVALAAEAAATPATGEPPPHPEPVPPVAVDPATGLVTLRHPVTPEPAAGGQAPMPSSPTGLLLLTGSLAALKPQLGALACGFGGELLLALADGRVLTVTARHRDALALPPRLAVPPPAVAGADRPIALELADGPVLALAGAPSHGVRPLALLPAQAQGSARRALAQDAALGTLLIAALPGLALLVLLNRIVLRPAARLHRAAHAVAVGQPQPALPPRRDDELGLLAGDLADIAERLGQYRDQIEELAFHDQLTGLPNRHLIRELLAARIAAAEGTRNLVAVLFIDLDNFKQINDNLGHDAGDQLLATFTARLGAVLAPYGLGHQTHLARFGGDELLIVAERLTRDGAAGTLAARVLQAAAEPFELNDGRYIVTASIGIALWPRDAAEPDALIQCADMAMYRAKAEGRNTYRYFSADMNAAASERLAIEHRLRRALDADELTLHYQPIVALASGELVALEALLRWTDPELGPVSPARFVPIAEESGLVQDLGRWVLHAVCAQIADWRADGLATVPVAVNISAAHVQREALAGPVADLLARFGLAARDLHLEITESVLMDLSQTNAQRLNALSELGLALHIDDFGTGYSSINYLRRFAIDCIKIDRSFIANLCAGEEDRALVTAMIAMAKALGLKVIAEGIEDEAQLAELKALGCEEGQGWLFARPAEPATIARCLTVPHRLLLGHPPRLADAVGG